MKITEIICIGGASPPPLDPSLQGAIDTGQWTYGIG